MVAVYLLLELLRCSFLSEPGYFFLSPLFSFTVSFFCGERFFSLGMLATYPKFNCTQTVPKRFGPSQL